MRFALVVLSLALVGCGIRPQDPNPYVEDTKAQVYEAMGELIVREIRNSTLPGPEPIHNASVPPPAAKAPAPSIERTRSIPPPAPPSYEFDNPFLDETELGYLDPAFRINRANR